MSALSPYQVEFRLKVLRLARDNRSMSARHFAVLVWPNNYRKHPNDKHRMGYGLLQRMYGDDLMEWKPGTPRDEVGDLTDRALKILQESDDAGRDKGTECLPDNI